MYESFVKSNLYGAYFFIVNLKIEIHKIKIVCRFSADYYKGLKILGSYQGREDT